jgi:hypothetical protein
VYGGTQLSWEWLTDASRAIVVGRVAECDKAGKFTLRVDRLLKRHQLEVELGQVVGGAILGRSGLYTEAPIIHEAGWPTLTDPSTYPGAGPQVTSLRPTFDRIESWGVGDRCLVFYAIDTRTPLHVINLDKPVKIEVDFLAVDQSGGIVTSAHKLIQRIEERVQKSLVGERPLVRSAGISYPIWSSPLDGNDYYYVLAPPNEQLARLSNASALAGSIPNGERGADDKDGAADDIAALQTRSILWPSGEQPGIPEMAPFAAWYWFHSGKTEETFVEDARAELNAAIHELWQRRRELVQRTTVNGGRKKPADEFNFDQAVSRDGYKFLRFQGFRTHRVNYRTYPLGWLCVLSWNAKNIVTVDGNRLELYSTVIDPSGRTADRQVHVSDDVHRSRTEVEFSVDGRYLAYTTADGSVCLFDLQDERLRWKRRAIPEPPASRAAWAVRGATLQFSRDSRWLAQQSQLVQPRVPEFPNPYERHQGPQFLQIWNVGEGRVALTPYDRWSVALQHISFHPTDADIVRIQSPTDANETPRTHELWRISSKQRLRVVSEEAGWSAANE